MMKRMKEIQGLQRGGMVQMQTGGVTNMRGSATPNLQRYKQAMDTFKGSMASNSQPIIIMGGGMKVSIMMLTMVAMMMVMMMRVMMVIVMIAM